jgi:hypothetical protein
VTQEIGKAFGMQAPPDHLDGIEAVESDDDIAQKASRLLLVLLLGPVARNAPAARRSRWSASHRSRPTPPGRYRAVEVLRDGLVVPTDDDGAIGAYPDKADQLRFCCCLVLSIVGCRHRSVLCPRRVGR